MRRGPGAPVRMAPVAALLALVLAAPTSSASEPVDPGEILAVDASMRQFLDQHVSHLAKPADRLSALKNAIFASRGLGLEYAEHENRTARETFAAGSGNCLSFTNLFVAMAREVGLSAYFSEVDEVLTLGQRGETLINNKHMFVGVEIENAHFLVDFTPGSEAPPGGAQGWGIPGRWARYRGVRRISDRRAAAHFYNNQGVEHLLRTGPRTALPYFGKAVDLAPELAAAWINLGVALRRRGSFEAAERAYQHAIEIDRSELAAFSNLAYLYETWGRKGDAEALLEKVGDYRRRNPFRHLSQGRWALEAGDLEQAIDHFREAVRRAPEEAELHFALGDALFRAGDLEAAETSLRKALKLATTEERQHHYTRALEALETLRALQPSLGVGGSGGP